MSAILEAVPFEFTANEAEGEMRRPPARRAGAPARAPARVSARVSARLPARIPARPPMRTNARPTMRPTPRPAARPVQRAGAARVTILPVAMPFPAYAPTYPANDAPHAGTIEAEPFPASAVAQDGRDDAGANVGGGDAGANVGFDAGGGAGLDAGGGAGLDAGADAGANAGAGGASDDQGHATDAGQAEYAAFSSYSAPYSSAYPSPYSSPYASPYASRRYPQPRPARIGNPYIRWVQHRLNQILGTSMRKSGILDAAARNALLRFQRIHGLRASGMLDLATRAALRSLPNRNYRNPAVRGTGQQAEIPSAIKHLIASGPAGTYPKYSNGPVPIQHIGAVAGLNVPGLYLITFNLKGQRRAYSGMSDNLHTRLTQHFRCLSFTGELERNYDVYYEKMPFPAGMPMTRANFAAHMKKVRDMEKALNSQRASLGGSLVNRTTELEYAPFQF